MFLTVALLHEIRGTGEAAVPWALGFFSARVVYVPAYLSGVPGLWSTAWVLGRARWDDRHADPLSGTRRPRSARAACRVPKVRLGSRQITLARSLSRGVRQ